MSMMVVCQSRLACLTALSENVIDPTRAGGEGWRFFSLRRSGVAGSGSGGNPSPALRRCGLALGGLLALGFSNSCPNDIAGRIITITSIRISMRFNGLLLWMGIFTRSIAPVLIDLSQFNDTAKPCLALHPSVPEKLPRNRVKPGGRKKALFGTVALLDAAKLSSNIPHPPAAVAELADALGSGPSPGNRVEVQVLSAALIDDGPGRKTRPARVWVPAIPRHL